MDLVQPFDDGERLGQRRTVVTLQRRHQPLWVDREVGGRALFALAKVMRQMLGREPLEVERDPDPVCRAAAEIAMQLHRNLPDSSGSFGFTTLTYPYCKYTVN